MGERKGGREGGREGGRGRDIVVCRRRSSRASLCELSPQPAGGPATRAVPGLRDVPWRLLHLGRHIRRSVPSVPSFLVCVPFLRLALLGQERRSGVKNERRPWFDRGMKHERYGEKCLASLSMARLQAYGLAFRPCQSYSRWHRHKEGNARVTPAKMWA